MPAAIQDLSAIELADVEDIVGSRSYQRGVRYARDMRVLAIEWDAETTTLTGSVLGQGAVYETAAFFADADGEPMLDDGSCTCPVGYNCKHVAALVYAAVSPFVSARRGAPGEGGTRIATGPRSRAVGRPVAAWEASLRALIAEPAGSAVGNPLAIELALQVDGRAERGAPKLLARVMHHGARGDWINGGLAWNRLDSWQLQAGNYRADHLAWLRELNAIREVEQDRRSYYSYGAEKALDLAKLDSARFWSLLDEAARIDLKLLQSGRGQRELPPYDAGELLIDVRGADSLDAAALRAVLRIGGEEATDLQPALFLGAGGHGLLCREVDHQAGEQDASAPRLRLVRLDRPAPSQLQKLLLEDAQLEVPATEMQRFAEEFFPALRRAAPITSSDSSFAPPEISEPALLLHAAYGPGQTLELGWRWRYQVGASERRAPLIPPASSEGFRDEQAERAILAATDLSDSGLDSCGLLDWKGQPAAAESVYLEGLENMLVTTNLLPGLIERPDLNVQIEGEAPDFRDVGETIAIGLSTREVAGERDWFDLGVSISVEGTDLPFAEVFAALAGGASHMLLADGAHFSLRDERLQELRRLIEEARELSDEPTAPLRISRYQAGLWSELQALGVVTEQAQAWRRQTSGLLELQSIAEHPLPPTLQAQLRPYQHEGFGWLATLWDLELGGILADDMGLGKTLQVLALICYALQQGSAKGPFLVVAPTSVVSGWLAEAARFAPSLKVATITDTLGKSGRAMAEIAEAEVVVTTYTLLRLDIDAYNSVDWAGLILDEAQYVKNHQAKTYACVRELAAPFKLALTGTPMENNLMELWSLLSITAPGLFPDPRRFAEQYARPIERAGDVQRLARLRRRIKPLLKRRTKELVASDLPAKQEQALEVDMHPRHRKLYDKYLQRERQKVLGLLDDFNRNRFTILRSITLLRQLSLHPVLIDAKHATIPCAKLSVLAEQLADVIGGGHRALVFSQFTRFLKLLAAQLEREGIGHCYLDGSTRRRERVLERFKEGDDPLFLISLKAGGFGLNLTEADYCFLLDPWWNPATEAQAIDRTHRIGQTRPVMVYRLISHDSIEEKVVALARRKAALFSGVLDEGDLFAGSLTAEDIRGLLG